MSIHDFFHCYDKIPDDDEKKSKWTLPSISGDFTMKKQLDAIVQNFEEGKIQPDVIGEIILKNNLNIMILDFYDYDKGFTISFLKFGDEEVLHGEYSYEVSLFESIKAGEIPCEVFADLHKYDFKIYYDGYVMCQLRIHFENEDYFRSHYVFLKHTIQTVDLECAKNCEAAGNLDYETERARLIAYYSPDLYLDFDPSASEIISSSWNRPSFITPFLKKIIDREKALRRKLTQEQTASKKHEIDKDWDLRVNDRDPEDAVLEGLASNLGSKESIVSYLRRRKICFPDIEYFTGAHVEIENIVYEYLEAGKVKKIRAKLSISVIDNREYYYSYFQRNEEMQESVHPYWSPIGRREELDLLIKAMTSEKIKLSTTEFVIIHNRMFEEKIEIVGGKVNIVRFKLQNPISEILYRKP